MRTKRYDRCPWCGFAEVCRLGSIKRACENKSCGWSYELPITAAEWEEEKFNLGVVSDVDYEHSYGMVANVAVPHRDIAGKLEDAQVYSDTGRAFVDLSDTRFHYYRVFWHRSGRAPEDETGNRCVAPGSPFWHMLNDARADAVWVPEVPLNAMEILAKAGGDEPMFAIMLP